MTITKKDIIERIADRTGARRPVVREVVQGLLETMAEELAAGRRIEFRDFGVFEVRVRGARVAQNPKTMQPVEVPQRATVKFKAGQALRARIARGPADASGARDGATSGGTDGPAEAPMVETKPAGRGRRAANP